jgi:hypothetical protein
MQACGGIRPSGKCSAGVASATSPPLGTAGLPCVQYPGTQEEDYILMRMRGHYPMILTRDAGNI